jgi:hypothetical protein
VADPEPVTAPAIDVGGPLIDVTGDVRTERRTVVRRVPLALGQALLIASALFILLGGWQRDFHVPFGFSSDSLWFLMQSKSTVDNGWWWSNPRLGAPFGLDERAYASNSNVDQAIVWAVSRVVPHAIAATNLAWMIVVVLSGLSASWCLRQLGISTINAMVFGTLFALSPYALYRHIDHFSLVIYLVPFACTAAMWLASGRHLQAWPATAPAIVLIGCALLSFDYVYYAFFGAFCILVGALIGYLATRDRWLLASGAIGLAVIVGCTLINLAPSFASWQQRGQPMVLRDKVPAEAEMFGLKIRQLISPVYPNRVPPFERWVKQEAAARFPNENENWTSRLGLIGTIGFLGLLVLLFIPDGVRPRLSSPLTRGASRLTMATLLLATVGGFGSLFSLFVSSDIRAYNRMCPFIAFFSLAAVAIACDALFKTARGRTVAAAVVLAIGLADQGQAAQHFTAEYAGNAIEIAGLETFVGTLERALPAQSMVLQLPFRTYMNESDVGGMKRYDHFKPYLVSRALRFSYPAFSNEQVRWQQAAARLPLRDLMPQLATDGFAAVLIDRAGYADRGAEVSDALLGIVGRDRILAQSDRYLALDIRVLAGARPSAASTSLAAAMSRDLSPASVSIEACKGPSLTEIEQIGPTRAPFGAGPIHVSGSDAIKVSGWAVDHPHRKAAAGVDVVVDSVPFPSVYGAARDDVANYFQRPGYRESGFTADVPAERLTAGAHTLSLRVVSADGTCFYQTRSMPMTVDR